MRRRNVLAVLCFFLGAGLLQGIEWRFSTGAGMCLLRQKEVQDVYGTGFPFGLQAWAGGKNWKISAGFEYLSERGQAVPLDGGADEFPLRLKVTSVPVGIFYETRIRSFFLAAGGGASYASYKETWDGLGIVVKGNKWGPFIALIGGYRLNPRWSVFGNFRYEPMPTGKSSLLVREVKLGGLKIGAGILFCL